MGFFTFDLAMRLFRTALQVAGGIAVGAGIGTEADWVTVSGAAVTLVTTVFTIVSARNAAKKAE